VGAARATNGRGQEDDVAGGRRGRGGDPADRGDARGIGNLVGGGPSIVGTSGAMRARDVSQPDADEIAAALERVVIRQRPPERAEGSDRGHRAARPTSVDETPKPHPPRPAPPT
jgi:hypothetical protein